MPGTILILAGAGASAAIDSDLYPTTARFFERLPDHVTSSPVFTNMVSYLQSQRGLERIDVEHLLWTLGELDDFLNHVSDTSSLPHWLLSHGKYAQLVRKSADLRPMLSLAKQIHPAVSELRDAVNEQVYDLYASPPDTKTLSQTWLPLLEAAVGLGHRLELFTTNYDLVLEYAIEEGNLPISSGREPSPLRPRLDLDAWKELQSQARGLLTKLHGSVDWSRQEREILVGNPLYKGDHGKHVIIYPGFKGAPAKEPFVTFHRHFARVLRGAVAAVFVGFGFRDEHINELITSSIPEGVPTLILNPDTELPIPFPDQASVHHIDKGFDKETARYVAGWLADSSRSI